MLRLRLALVLLAPPLGLGCRAASTEPTPRVAAATPAASTSPDEPARAEPTPAEPEPAPAEATTAEPTRGTDREITRSTGQGPAEANEPVAEGSLPEWSAFHAAAREDGWGSPAKASQRVALGTDGAVAIVRLSQGEGDDARWRIVAVRLRREAEAWAPAGTHRLEEWSAHPDLGRDGSIAVNLRVDDVDTDGELELVTRYRLDWMCCGAGATTKRTLVILNDDARLTEAAYLDLDEEVYFGGTKGRERFEDRDADGHADLVVSWTSTREGEPPGTGEQVHAWTKERDAFERALRPQGEECICE